MAPTSYQGPMEYSEADKHTHSQTEEWSLGVGAPGITVGDILGHKGDDVHSVGPHTTVKEVIGTLARLRIGALVVINSEKEPIGIVSERDIILKFDTVGLEVVERPVEEIMTRDPISCTPDYKIEEVMNLMSKRGFRHLPVLEDGKLCGVISIRDVVRHRLQEVEYENLKIKQAMVG